MIVLYCTNLIGVRKYMIVLTLRFIFHCIMLYVNRNVHRGLNASMTLRGLNPDRLILLDILHLTEITL